MKKTLCILSVLLLLLCSCGSTNGVQTQTVSSAIFTQDDIDSAIVIAKREFIKEFDGCKMKTISYAGDSEIAKNQDYLEYYNADEVIVLVSSFETGESGINPGLNPNQTYKGWTWILVRIKDGKWQYVSCGY